MKRTIITPPEIVPAALDELKDWLAITTQAQDAVLTGLLHAALDTCEDFTGQLAIESECEEILPAAAQWQRLYSRPVQAITQVDGIPADGPRFALSGTAYEVELDADGGARIRVITQGSAGRVAVRFIAGLSADWAAMPLGLRHGVIRLAAFLYRDRDAGPAANPPAAIAALWRPWRWLQLA